MNIRDLEYLVALDKYRHFRKAAEAVYVTQPTLSGQLKKLEQYLGVQLVERGRKQQVLMTPIGAQIVIKAKQLLQQAQEIEQIAQHAQDPFKGPLKLGIIPTLAPYILPLIVRPIKNHFPQMDLLLYERQTSVLLDELQNGEIELGLLALPIESEGMETLPLFEEKFFLAVPTGHHLSQATAIAIEDLKNETLLLLDDGHCFRDQALELCFRGGGHEKESFRGTSLETLKQMSLIGSGITLLPALALDQDPALSYIPFQDPQPARQMALIYRQTSPRSAAYQELGRQIQKALQPKIENKRIQYL